MTAGPGGTTGQYFLEGFGAGNYTIGVTKTTGQNGISSNDAALIAQHVAGISAITSNNKLIAADASANGAISSNDAALIARFATGLGAPIGQTNTWKFFVPGVGFPTFPIGASPTTRSYADPIGNQTGQDYVGILIGEVSGNWNNTGARSTDSEPTENDVESSVAVNLPQVVVSADNEVLIPVTIRGAADKNIISYEFDLRYDPNVIHPQADPVDLKDTASRGLFSAVNEIETGLLRVVMYGPLPIDGKDVLLNLRFTAVGASGSSSPLSFERIIFNDGDPTALITAGQVELSGIASTSQIE